jgi:rhomboid family GlyGly-CTERM serine protease
LEYDRGAVAGGELWRLVTGHLTHLSGEHLLWDALTFAVLAAACERRGRWRLAATLAVSAMAIPAALFVLEPGLAVYRGLSGLDMALAGLLAATELRRGSRWAMAALLALGAKLAYELATGAVLFVALEGAEAVPLAHAVGAGAGVCVGLWRVRPCRTPAWQPGLG